MRWELIASLVGTEESVLDIGCRDKALRKHLDGCSRYVGLDLFPPADVIGSAEEPLPFADNEFDLRRARGRSRTPQRPPLGA